MYMKILILVVALFVLYKFFVNDKGKRKEDDSKDREKKIAKGAMVKDPICGTYVDKEGSISVRDGSVIHRFCSYECREKFLQQLEDGGRSIPGRLEDEE